MDTEGFKKKEGHRWILGIDPGFFGSLVVVDVTESKIVTYLDMPLCERHSLMKKENGRSDINIKVVCEFIKSVSSHVDAAVIERVNASPNMGVVSAFRFGEGFGVLCGALVYAGIQNVVMAYPNVWKADLGLDRSKKKSLAMAIEIFKQDKSLFKLSKFDGRAEAALLAWFGRKALTGEKIKDPFFDAEHISDLF